VHKITSKRKIFFLIRSLHPGGAERQLVVSAKGLSERGHDVAVLTFYSGGDYERDLLNTKVRLLGIGKKSRWDLASFFFRLVTLLRREKPDVVYSFLGGANIFSALSRPFARQMLLVWGVRASNMDLHQYDWLSRYSYWVECRLARFADYVVANSHAGLMYAVDHGFPRSTISVISNGIDTGYFRIDEALGMRMREKWGVADDERLIGLVGRIDPMKGHVTFLKAAARIRQRLPNIRFVCVGAGERRYEASLRKLATDMGLDESLVWAGSDSNMPAVYNSLNIASSSSSYGEGFPNVVGEAMACGVPCIVTDVGDSARVVGPSGIVVPPNDDEALCSAWIKMLSFDSKKLRALSIFSRNRIVDQFSVDALLDSSESLLCGNSDPAWPS